MIGLLETALTAEVANRLTKYRLSRYHYDIPYLAIGQDRYVVRITNDECGLDLTCGIEDGSDIRMFVDWPLIKLSDPRALEHLVDFFRKHG